MNTPPPDLMRALAPRRDRIYLTGFMGSGKSTIGPILANTIGYRFVDIDRAIERSTGKTVNEIFREWGEERFRELEKETLATCARSVHHVISLGGGTIMDPGNLQVVTGSGILIYLKTSPEQILRRVRRRDDRPVLSDAMGERLSDEALRARIDTLYRLREPVYAGADLTFATDERRVGLTVDEIVRVLSRIVG
jgi:shikimate kinase